MKAVNESRFNQNDDNNNIGNNSNEGDGLIDNEAQPQDFDLEAKVAAVMTDLSMLKIAEIEKTLADLTFVKESFKEDNSKTLYYTGLPSYKILYFLEQWTAPFLFRQNARCSTFQQLVLTLMKLRFNSDMRDLANRFVYKKYNHLNRL